MALAPGTHLGSFEIVASIGAGGMGEVYRAIDSQLKRQVAVKVLPAVMAADADRLARFQREAQVLAALNHPNIAAIYGLEKAPHLTALIMELVDGDDLSVSIARGALSLQEALSIARQVAEALEAAHDAGIVHRDLKPANIKVRPDGTVKVLDFGLAKIADPAGVSAPDVANSPTLTSPAMTAMGMILGTAAYMAPEQARGRAVDRRADVWAFGAVLYEMLTGRRAFAGDDISITLAAVLKDDVDWDALPAGLPVAVRRLLSRCLEKDPKQRLQAIGEARLTLDRVMAGQEDAATATLSPAPVPGDARPWRLLTAALALTTLALGVIAVEHVRERGPISPVMRFQVPAPGDNVSAPVVSPDGLLVAFRASDRLWVHALESSTTWALPGTEGFAAMPFWAPDSRALAFRLGNRLLKVALAGGRPQPIVDIPEVYFGGSWSSTGTILFATDTGLMQVSDAGGAPTLLLPREPDRQATTLAWPKFLPDGRRFVYSVRTMTSGNADEVDFYTASLDGPPTPRRLMNALDANAVAGYVQSTDTGVIYILFARPGALMIQGLDSETLSLIGEPKRIEADLASEGTPWASVSQNGILAYQSARGAVQSQLTWFSRDGTAGAVESAAGRQLPFSVSRDGTHVAIQRQGAGNTDVWVIDVARGTTTRVTTDVGDDLRPILSADGSRVAFSRGGTMYVRSATGAGAEEPLGDGELTDWSGDGRFISVERDNDLFVLPFSGGGTPIPIATGDGIERRGRFSPDGQWIAYESNVSGRYEIYLQSFPPSADHLQVISADGGDSVHWRGDGRELFYRSQDNRMMAVDITPGAKIIPGVPRALFQLPDEATGRFVASPDGQRFLVPLGLDGATPPIIIALNWLGPIEQRATGGQR